MLDPIFITREKEKALYEMERRFSGNLYKQFIQVYEKLERVNKISPNKLLKLSREVTLKDLNDGVKNNDLLMVLIDTYLRLPNICDSSVPIGRDKEGDVIIYSSKALNRNLPRRPKSYESLGNGLGIFNKAVNLKVTGDGFPFLFGMGASLDRAIINLMLDTHKKNGYKEILAPTLVNERSMFVTGAFPFFGNKSYHIEDTDLYLNPTIEVQETNIFRNVKFDNKHKLPVRIVGYSRSFRIEDKPMTTYSLLHEFGKVEIIIATTHEDWKKEYENALNSVEEVLKKLELPYRKVLLCTGSMGQGCHLTYDFYVYTPGSDKWLEVASCVSNSDFSSRRMNTTYADSSGKKRYIYTLHVTALAIPRIFCAILENHQTKDGKIDIPKALRPYINNKENIAKSDQPDLLLL